MCAVRSTRSGSCARGGRTRRADRTTGHHRPARVGGLLGLTARMGVGGALGTARSRGHLCRGRGQRRWRPRAASADGSDGGERWWPPPRERTHGKKRMATHQILGHGKGAEDACARQQARHSHVCAGDEAVEQAGGRAEAGALMVEVGDEEQQPHGERRPEHLVRLRETTSVLRTGRERTRGSCTRRLSLAAPRTRGPRTKSWSLKRDAYFMLLVTIRTKQKKCSTYQSTSWLSRISVRMPATPIVMMTTHSTSSVVTCAS